MPIQRIEYCVDGTPAAGDPGTEKPSDGLAWVVAEAIGWVKPWPAKNCSVRPGAGDGSSVMLSALIVWALGSAARLAMKWLGLFGSKATAPTAA